MGRVRRAQEDHRRLCDVSAAGAAARAPGAPHAPLGGADGGDGRALAGWHRGVQAAHGARGRAAHLPRGGRGHCQLGRQGVADRGEAPRHLRRLVRRAALLCQLQKPRADHAQGGGDGGAHGKGGGDPDGARLNARLALRHAVPRLGAVVGEQALERLRRPRGVDTGAGDVHLPRGGLHQRRHCQAAAAGVEALQLDRRRLGEDHGQGPRDAQRRRVHCGQ